MNLKSPPSLFAGMGPIELDLAVSPDVGARSRAAPRVTRQHRSQHSFLIVFIASPPSLLRAHIYIITMFFENLRSIVRIAWGWVDTVAIGPVGGWGSSRRVRITLRVKIVAGTQKIVDLVLQPVRLALPRGAAAVQGGEIEEV
ncbi:hypothetical protein EDB85DRAFT_2159470 [Lactarius pseudohatsudake]|nr:hypothetical protein EDB85DRAFT_2159470 [Lactarius pseudohatsudake]